MARRMRDQAFRQEQIDNIYSPHIKPVNGLVDRLKVSENGWIPYVAPLYGGRNARLLSLLRDPGPKTQVDGGSGFICIENDDPTAELMCQMFDQFNISVSEAMLWNIYPWYINQKPLVEQIHKGVDVLVELLNLLPNLEVVMLHGSDAKRGWKMLVKRHPHILNKQLKVIETYHTSRQAFWHRDPAVRQARNESLSSAFLTCSTLLNNH